MSYLLIFTHCLLYLHFQNRNDSLKRNDSVKRTGGLSTLEEGTDEEEANLTDTSSRVSARTGQTDRHSTTRYRAILQIKYYIYHNELSEIPIRYSPKNFSWLISSLQLEVIFLLHLIRKSQFA